MLIETATNFENSEKMCSQKTLSQQTSLRTVSITYQFAKLLETAENSYNRPFMKRSENLFNTFVAAE